MKFILACVLFFCAFELKIVQCDQAVEVYSISTPVQASKSVSLCINTANQIFDLTRLQRLAAPVITAGLCSTVRSDPSVQPNNIVYFCGNLSIIHPSDVRVTEITQDFLRSFNTTFYVYAIVRYLGSAYVVNNDIVTASITSSEIGYLDVTSCDPLNSTTVTPSDEYDASALSGMSIFASVVLFVELIIVGVFTIIWLEYGMGHLVSATTVQEITEGVEEFVTGL